MKKLLLLSTLLLIWLTVGCASTPTQNQHEYLEEVNLIVLDDRIANPPIEPVYVMAYNHEPTPANEPLTIREPLNYTAEEFAIDALSNAMVNALLP